MRLLFTLFTLSFLSCSEAPLPPVQKPIKSNGASKKLATDEDVFHAIARDNSVKLAVVLANNSYPNNYRIIASTENDVPYHRGGDLSLIHLAIAHKSYSALSILLESGFDVNTPNSLGYYPLHTACINGDISAALTLIKNGASVKVTTGAGEYPGDFLDENVAEMGDAAQLVEMLSVRE